MKPMVMKQPSRNSHSHLPVQLLHQPMDNACHWLYNFQFSWWTWQNMGKAELKMHCGEGSRGLECHNCYAYYSYNAGVHLTYASHSRDTHRGKLSDGGWGGWNNRQSSRAEPAHRNGTPGGRNITSPRREMERSEAREHNAHPVPCSNLNLNPMHVHHRGPVSRFAHHTS